jgi:uncharacterized protein with PIN domain
MMWLRVFAYRRLLHLASWLRLRGNMDAYYKTMALAMIVLFGRNKNG